jgi:aryl-alcohol dehydrogenase-like predicted oxidoreductase
MAMDDTGTRQGASRRYIMSAVEHSLKRLNTDWIDLYQLHRPDPRTPIEETLRALDDLVRQGKVRRIGCSYLTGAALDAAQAASAKHGLAAFITCQNEYSLLARGIERDLVPAMARHGVGLLPYLPLAGGLLTGKYRRDAAMPMGSRLSYYTRLADQVMTDANWQKLERLEAFGAARGKNLLDIAMGWLAARPFVASIIAGATTPAQVEANVAAAQWRPDAAEIAELDRITL